VGGTGLEPVTPSLSNRRPGLVTVCYGLSTRFGGLPTSHDTPHWRVNGWRRWRRGRPHTKLEDTKEEHLALAVEALDRLASMTIDRVS
jgi:hypothetical protein